jgi:hypothetical protein
MLLHVRQATFTGPRSAVSELLTDYTNRLIDITEADVELWRIDQGRPEGQVIWAAWASSHQRVRMVMDSTRGDRPLHALRTELDRYANGAMEEMFLAAEIGAASQMRSRPGFVADFGRAGLDSGMQSVALARLRSAHIHSGAILRPLWGNGPEICWWLPYRSLDDLDRAGHPGPVQRVIESTEIAGRSILRPGTTERLLLTRML